MRATAVTTIRASLTGPQNSPAPPKNRASAIPDRISATIATQPDRLARRSRSAVAIIDLTVLRASDSDARMLDFYWLPCQSMNMGGPVPRTYRLGKRAETQAETRDRIV